jgi:hypothetical protein
LVKDKKDDCLQYFEYVKEPIVSVLLNYAGANGVRQAQTHMAEQIAFEAEIAIENVNIY